MGRKGTPNFNSEWLNYRGTWILNLVLIGALRLVFATFPFLSTEASWTVTNLLHNLVRKSSAAGLVLGRGTWPRFERSVVLRVIRDTVDWSAGRAYVLMWEG
jgi:hypothetical protein